MRGALDGIKVLELSRVLAGPWCGMTLADLGADVIKLEPLDGDDTRGLGPPFRDGLSAYFACCNRNKRSLALDLRRSESRPLVEALLRWADVVIENFRSGVTQTLGIDPARAAAINPRLVYCSISGYGRDGSGAERAGYDFVVQAEAGLMGVTGAADGEPCRAGVAVVDLATGQNAAIAILAALRARDRDGVGQAIEVSLFDTQLAGLANVGANVQFSGADARRWGNQHPNIVPYQAFRASDADFVLAVASEKLWRALCRVLDRGDWLDDPRYAGNAARVAQRDALCTQLAAIFATQPVAHWLQRFGAAGIPAAPVNTVQQALGSPLAIERGASIDIDGVPGIASPLRMAATPVRYRRPPPQLGEHDDEIARALGIDPAPLRAAGALR